MSLEDLYSKPAHLIRRAHQISWAIFLDECAEFNLTPVQYAALAAIESREPTDATRLSALIAFDRATIGNVLERLEKRELIRRQSAPDDKRQKQIYLTDLGRQLLKRVTPAVETVQNRIVASLSREEREIFLQLLTRITKINNDVTSAPLRLADE